MSAATSGTITIDHETKSILQNFTHEPDAVKGVAIPEDLAAPLASLALHRIDLIRAVRFLGEIGQQGGVSRGGPVSIVCHALWYAALVSTMKCFQHSRSRAETLS